MRSCAAGLGTGVGGRLFVFGGWNGVTHDGGAARPSTRQTGAWEVLCDADVVRCRARRRGEPSQLVVDPQERRRLLVSAARTGPYFDDLWSLRR